MKTLYKTLSILSCTVVIALSAYGITHTVTVNDGSFSPATLSVQVGDTIRWVRNSANANDHTTTSAVVPSGATMWDSPITAANPEFSYHVTVPGSYGYVCTPHATSGMVGGFSASDATIINPTLNAGGINIFHNANDGSIHVMLDDYAATKSFVNIVDVNGRMVKSFDTNISTKSFSIADLPKGIYFVNVRNNKLITTRKIAVN